MSVSDRALAASSLEKHKAACREIRKHLPSFLAVGEQLLIIRELNVWQQTHKTLEAFINDEFGLEKRRAYQLIEAATVKANLECTNRTLELPSLPSNEWQFRELAKAPVEQQAEVVRKAAEKAAEENRKPTAKDYKKVVGELLSESEPEPEPGKTEEPTESVVSKDEQVKIECKKARSYAEYLQRSIDDLNRLKRNAAVHSELIKLCGQLLERLKRW